MIHMQQNSEMTAVSYLAGSESIVDAMPRVPAKQVYDDAVIGFLNTVSEKLMKDPSNKAWPDVISFAFWIRKSALTQKKNSFAAEHKGPGVRTGKGVLFHIAPSNVPVNFAYSLAVGALAGNCDIVRIPSKEFPQTQIVAKAFSEALDEHPDMRPYLAIVRYGHDKDLNDRFSAMADVRIVWGGDETIGELRRSPLPPRSTEITFADRYSIAVIDAEKYLDTDDKAGVARDFYNDTYYTDQNACTSPRAVVWLGRNRKEAKELFWQHLYDHVRKNYTYQDIQGVNKLTSACLCASVQDCVLEEHSDNLIVRVSTGRLTREIMRFRDNSGFFIETDCDDIMELREVCDDKRCQTIGILGDKAVLEPLILSGIRGVDRVVPIGHTMDFDTVWDGYDLIGEFSRMIMI